MPKKLTLVILPLFIILTLHQGLTLYFFSIYANPIFDVDPVTIKSSYFSPLKRQIEYELEVYGQSINAILKPNLLGNKLFLHIPDLAITGEDSLAGITLKSGPIKHQIDLSSPLSFGQAKPLSILSTVEDFKARVEDNDKFIALDIQHVSSYYPLGEDSTEFMKVKIKALALNSNHDDATVAVGIDTLNTSFSLKQHSKNNNLSMTDFFAKGTVLDTPVNERLAYMKVSYSFPEDKLNLQAKDYKSAGKIDFKELSVSILNNDITSMVIDQLNLYDQDLHYFAIPPESGRRITALSPMQIEYQYNPITQKTSLTNDTSAFILKLQATREKDTTDGNATIILKNDAQAYFDVIDDPKSKAFLANTKQLETRFSLLHDGSILDTLEVHNTWQSKSNQYFKDSMRFIKSDNIIEKIEMNDEILDVSLDLNIDATINTPITLYLLSEVLNQPSIHQALKDISLPVIIKTQSP
ncbi:hypothetical protein OAT84_01760 [Gammaproteobacteria bacterium]|nr:hypothetical protein [Gammaproteobacteria bacterium]